MNATKHHFFTKYYDGYFFVDLAASGGVADLVWGLKRLLACFQGSKKIVDIQRFSYFCETDIFFNDFFVQRFFSTIFLFPTIFLQRFFLACFSMFCQRFSSGIFLFNDFSSTIFVELN